MKHAIRLAAKSLGHYDQADWDRQANACKH